MRRGVDLAVLLLFVAILLCCVVTGISVLYALVLGYVLFAVYSLCRGFSVEELVQMSVNGIKTARKVLITFMLIGILTALWRQSGTIPAIVSYSSNLIVPKFFPVIAFLLNCALSFLTGTAFGTAATMGSICMTIGLAFNMDPVVMGGAILSGVFWGDRCSLVSTSALLVSEVTGTNLYNNIKLMFRTSMVPFALACAIYVLIGFMMPFVDGEVPDVTGMFAREFNIGLVAVVPAVVILLFAFARVNVMKTMSASIVAAAAVCVMYQGVPFKEVLLCALSGFEAKDAELALMLDGGGVISMLKVAGIVCISASYAGIFQKTGLLDAVIELIARMNSKLSSFVTVVIISVLSGAVSCNQTLAIMLTQQLCSNIVPDRQKFAIYLENSVVLIAPTIPWSIASGVPLTSVGAPVVAICMAFYLFLVPICYAVQQYFAGRIQKKC